LRKDLYAAAEREVNHGRSLELAMEIFGYTAADIARKLDLKRQTISKQITSKKFSDDRVTELCAIFNITPEAFDRLPHAPISNMMKFTNREIIDMLMTNMPGKGRYIREAEKHLEQAHKIIATLEV
jgi:plasmid maintenance system antidote protein VapI